jgi:hypothetical protein
MAVSVIVHRQHVPYHLIHDVRKRLLLEIRRVGLAAHDIAQWSSSTWFPTLRDEPCVRRIQTEVGHLARTLSGDVWAEPQIVVRLPDEPDTPQGEPHVDTEPPWATSLRYYRIFGVELTNGERNGGNLVVYPEGGIDQEVVMGSGDVVQMTPDVLHAGSPNHSASIRMALYFRLMEKIT